MAERDCTAVNVQLLTRQLELRLDRTRLRRERFVHFDKIHVVERHLRGAQRVPGRGDWSDTHDLRIDAGNTPGNKAAERLFPGALRVLLTGDHQRARAVPDSRGVSCRHQTVGAEIGLQLGESLERGVGSMCSSRANCFTWPYGLSPVPTRLIGENVGVPTPAWRASATDMRTIDARPPSLYCTARFSAVSAIDIRRRSFNDSQSESSSREPFREA